MNLLTAVLACVMAFYNCSKGLNGSSAMNFVMAALWLAIGIVYTVRYVKERKQAKKNKELREREG